MRRLIVALAVLLVSACTLRPPLPELLDAAPAVPPSTANSSANSSAPAQESAQELHVPRFPPPTLSDRIIKRICNIRFDDPEALGKLPDSASDGIARWAQYNHGSCKSADGSGCWMYKQNCG
ncbi:MAG: hypothetical protein AB8B93_15050, partial [Pseudomonadales bacterium]